MTAQTFLEQGYGIEALVSLKQAELDMLRLQKDSITSPDWESDMIGSSPSSAAAYERCINKIEDNIEIVISKMTELNEKRAKISFVIEKVPDQTQQAVLTRRYILFQRYNVIATEMGYSERQIYNIHADALETVQKILDESLH